MKKTLIATDDASIYQAFPTINTGFDEILEIGKLRDVDIFGSTFISSSVRSLVMFNIESSGSWNVSASYYLNLRLASALEINKGQTIEVGHISSSWDEGSGYFYQTPVNRFDGATWGQKTQLVSWSNAGGDLTTSITSSYALTSYPIDDLRIDITSVMAPIVASGQVFNGLYIKFPDLDELDRRNSGNLKVFSTQTHTIYQPTMDVVWDDQLFTTGSLLSLPDTNFHISANVKKTYYKNNIEKIRFQAREQFPSKKFDNVQRYANKYYLPFNSYFRVVDVQSNAIYGRFDGASAVNCDTSGSYMILDTTSLYKNREYRIELQLNFSSGLVSIIPVSQTFEII